MSKKQPRARKNKKLTQNQLQSAILRLFKKEPKRRYNAGQIKSKLRISNSKDAIVAAMSKLDQEQVIQFVKDGKFRLNKSVAKGKGPVVRKKMEGRVDMTRSGSAFIIVEGQENDIFVSARNLKGALQGDIVLVDAQMSKYKRRPDGKVIKVLKRARHKFVGTLQMFRKYSVVYVDHPKMALDINIRPEHKNKAEEGDRVVVQVTSFGDGQNPKIWGEVTSILGADDSNELEMNTILINNGFDIEFPDDVLKETAAMSDKITDADLKARRDMRDVWTITIDPHDAKDFDDAISYQVLKNGNMEVGVHIADVTHFVKPGTALDEEAFERSTSVYLVDRVCPMLPERLSNELCSLRPNEDKFTFSAVFEFDAKYSIVNRWFGKTLTHSDRRFTYEEAQEVITKKSKEYSKEILTLDKIAKHLKKKKFSNGAINFESDEVKFKLDENKKPIGLYVKSRFDAHMLVEEYMLLANREVAKYMATKVKAPEVPFVYRVHDVPDPDKLAEFALFASELGIKMNIDTPKNIAKSFNKMNKMSEDNDAIKMIQPMAIRTMSKAIYTTDNIGHYGLAFDYYTHFTSPIRRYSDVLVHRILQKNLSKVNREPKEALELRCQHISNQERKANDAERQSTKYKQVEYMMDRVGEEFDGIVSGMINRGLFVELKDSKAEGLLSFENMDEPYALVGNLKAIGKRTGKVIKMGDSIKIKLAGADLSKKELDFEWID